MRLFLLLALMLAIDAYAFQAFSFWSQDWSSKGQSILNFTFWSIPFLAAAWIAAHQIGWTQTWPMRVFTFVRAFFILIYLAKLLIVGVVFIDDIRRITLWLFSAGNMPLAGIQRSNFLVHFAIALGMIPLLTLSYGMVRNPYRYQLHTERVRITNLPEALKGLRIVHISDIHAGSFNRTAPLRKAIEMINRQEPDLVFFTGDLVNYRSDEMLPYTEVFKDIRARYGVFSVLGNHDYGDYVAWESTQDKVDNLQQLVQIQTDMGWQLLRNEHQQITINGHKVAVIGVENFSALPRFPRYGRLSQAYTGSEPADLKLLLSHDPTHWEAEVTADYPEIALTFSGHTHGMQFGFEIPGVVKWSPAQYMYKQWAGLYRQGQQWLYVNRGFGMLGYPGRVGILPEITRVELH